MHQDKQDNQPKRMNALLRNLTDRSRLFGNKRSVTFRIDNDVDEMLKEATKDHPIQSRIINECLRQYLSASGYNKANGKKAA